MSESSCFEKCILYSVRLEGIFIVPFSVWLFSVSGEEFKGMKLSLWTSTSNHIKHGRIELAISPSCRQFVNQAVNLLPSTTDKAAAWFPSHSLLDFLCIWLCVSNPCLHSGCDPRAVQSFLLCSPWPGQGLWALSMLQGTGTKKPSGAVEPPELQNSENRSAVLQLPCHNNNKKEEGGINLFFFPSCQCCSKPREMGWGGGKYPSPTNCPATAVHIIGCFIFFPPWTWGSWCCSGVWVPGEGQGKLTASTLLLGAAAHCSYCSQLCRKTSFLCPGFNFLTNPANSCFFLSFFFFPPLHTKKNFSVKKRGLVLGMEHSNMSIINKSGCPHK